ncbi:MAG: Wzz/FepE/Etk N-terminal domain-containing protein [Gammaproteobacteria bacterium]
MQSNIENDEIDLKELFFNFWAYRFKIFVITSIFALSSLIYSLSLSDQYKATVVLAPSQSSQGGLSSALGQLGGFASVAGLNLDKTEVDEAKIAQEVMRSWSFIDHFISENDLMAEVYAVTGWNKQLNQYEVDKTIYDTQNKKWLYKNRADIIGPPTSWTLYEEFLKKLEVSLDKQTGLVTLSIEHYSPYVAKEWVDMYLQAINSYMQQRRIERITNNIDYLSEQIDQTQINEMRTAFFNIMEEQIKNKMLAEASPEYVFVTVSPAMVPELKSKPSRALICILLTFLGFVLSLVYVIISNYFRDEDNT